MLYPLCKIIHCRDNIFLAIWWWSKWPKLFISCLILAQQYFSAVVACAFFRPKYHFSYFLLNKLILLLRNVYIHLINKTFLWNQVQNFVLWRKILFTFVKISLSKRIFIPFAAYLMFCSFLEHSSGLFLIYCLNNQHHCGVCHFHKLSKLNSCDKSDRRISLGCASVFFGKNHSEQWSVITL